jgi:hypothetical protein
MTDTLSRRLTPWFLFVEAFRTFCARWRRVLGIGALVSAFAITSDSLLDAMLSAQRDDATGGVLFVIVVVSLALSAANGFGTTFLSGVLDRTVGEHQHGEEQESLGQLLVRIPYIWLILADVLTIVIKVVGFILLIIPGFMAITLMCIVGPVVMVERRRPFAAVRRSAQLVWPHFWLTFAAVTIPLLAEGSLSDAVESADWLHGFPQHLAVGVLIEAPVAIFVSLVEVTLAHQLMRRDRAKLSP